MNFKLNKSFSVSNEIKYLIFFDFDETYYPHACTKEQLNSLYELEEYLNKLSKEQAVKIGWITGSDLYQIDHKVNRTKMVYSPHFIASNLGTEVYDVRENGQLIANKEWVSRLQNSSFTSNKITELVRELNHQFRIKLVEQTQLGQKRYKFNYYYYMSSQTQTQHDLNIIRHLAKINGIGLNINRCNPNAGDPEDAFDVDFIPKYTGKKEVVKFMMNHYKVPITNTIAFGDSGNDVDMLKTVQHGYLLANATAEAKNLHPKVTQSDYSKGILEVLKNIFGDMKKED
ncbi:HAD-IIB family hydrolase [Metabacillus niabensis]|uniref:HAD-IIB family hydrolase n=1 Tax=Metabacillus niabensis TaxID=324854 RepID=UPI001CF9B048|nr:HAD-IIB family hydrolase [Metabacillus niabensis]